MEYDCVLKCGKTCDVKDVISADRWDRLKPKSERWKGLDRFGEVFDTTDWDNGPDGFYMHANLSRGKTRTLLKLLLRNLQTMMIRSLLLLL